MPDVVVEIFGDVSTHNLPRRPHSFRNKRGDVHRIQRLQDIQHCVEEVGGGYQFNYSVTNSKLFVWLFIRDAPAKIRKLEQPERYTKKLHRNGSKVYEARRKRRWFLKLSDLPTSVKIDLRDKRQANISWPDFKAACYKKHIIDRENSDADTKVLVTLSDVS